MFKTCISIAAVGKAPDIAKKVIDEIGWPISTIIIEPGRVSFYFCFKWYDYFYVRKIKREVKRCEERCKYYCKPDIYGGFLSEAELHYLHEDQEATARLIYAAFRKDPKGENVEAIVNESGDVIGCKIRFPWNLRRN